MLHLHRSERADRLVDALGDVVAAPLDDAMAAEVVAVPTRGVERWITQRLSERLGAGAAGGDGVCANVEFPFPGRLVLSSTARATGIDADDDPWAPDRLVWPLLEVVDGCLAEPWLMPLARHLGAPSGEAPVRRFPAVRHVADLFDRYGVHRPDLILSWAGGTVPPRADEVWQAELWRRLRARVGVPSLAERLPDAAVQLARDPGMLDLPSRLSLFGLTRLPPTYLTVLDAIAANREVHLFLLHPSAALWDAVAASVPAPVGRVPRTQDPTAQLAHHPLLRSWGRDSREMQLVLAATSADVVDEHRPVAPASASLLHRLQADIRGDRVPAGRPRAGDIDERPGLDPADRSVQVHSCHGRARQVEVVRDAVLHLLAEDPTLEPRDVIIMCPDIETFAPLIHAAFGRGEVADGAATLPDIQVRLADRALRQTNPVLGLLAHLLEMATSRVTATDVLDLAGREPVRRRFHFDDDDLAQIQSWLASTGIRWGLDAEHRARWGLEGLSANTWEAGLDRLLLGVAMSEEGQRLVGGVLPLDDVSSNEVELAGRFAELVTRLGGALRALCTCRTFVEWVPTIVEAVDALAATGSRDGWQRDELHRVLDEVATAGAGSLAPIDTSELRAVLGDRLRGRPTRANFRTGHLTICTLVPMRSVPHRVVCLLGIDDGTFPRTTERDGDDLIAADPHVGDRDSRTEDRQLLLDALLAATDQLIITYAGRDVRTNQRRPPAVPVAELLDVIDRTVRPAGAGEPARRARDQVVTEHPLQPFDPRNFTPGDVVSGSDRAWSFDAVNLAGATALVAASPATRRLLGSPLPPFDAPVIELAALVRFVEHPVRAFFRERLGVYLRSRDEEVLDALPVELDPLQRWAVGDRLLRGVLAGGSLERCVEAERARGMIPPGALPDAMLARVGGIVDDVVSVTRRERPRGLESCSLDVSLDLGDGRRIVGSVPSVWGSLILSVTYSHLGPKHRLASWVHFLALTACRPELAMSATVIGQGDKGKNVAVARLAPLAADAETRQRTALQELAMLLDLFDRGMRQPLPLYCKTSAAYAESRLRHPDRDAWDAARRAWESGLYGEQTDPEHLLIHEGRSALEEVADEAAGAELAGPGWATDEVTAFGRFALRLWTGLLARESVSDD